MNALGCGNRLFIPEYREKSHLEVFYPRIHGEKSHLGVYLRFLSPNFVTDNFYFGQ